MKKIIKFLVALLSFFVLACLILNACSERKAKSNKPSTQLADSIVKVALDSIDANPHLSRTLLTSVIEQYTPADSSEYYKLYSSIIVTYLHANEFDSLVGMTQRLLRFCKNQPFSSENQQLLIEGYNILGIYNNEMRNSDSAIYYFKLVIDLLKQFAPKSELVSSYINLSDVYAKQGNYVNCIFYLRNAFSISDSLEIQQQFGFPLYFGLAQAYLGLGDFDLSDRYFRLAEPFYMGLSLGERFSFCNNRGNYYYYKGEYSEALPWFIRARAVVMPGGYQFHISLCETNLGDIYCKLNKPDSAHYCLDRSYQYFSEINHYTALFYIATVKAELALKQNNIALARQWLQKYTNPAGVDAQLVVLRNKCDQHYYRATSDYRKAYESLLQNVYLEDSIKSEKVKNRVAELDMRYKQDSTLLRRDLQIQSQRGEIEYLRMIRYLWVLVSAVSIILALLIFFNLRRKKKTNRILTAKNDEIEHKNAELKWQNEEIRNQRDEIEAQRDEIEAQRDEIEAQRDYVIQQKMQIEVMHQKLTDSIDYARLIQNAVLPDDKFIKDLFPMSFVLFKPRDVVSGDFYWVAQQGDWKFIAIGDCTGHGVPGAFMSMLAISFLNELDAKSSIKTAAAVLNEMRDYIIASLRQQGAMGEQKDGLDMAFVMLNTSTLELQYSGGNFPLYIYRGVTGVMDKIRGDAMPIAIHLQMQPFSNSTVQLTRGDSFYLFSDGYPDQFGGEKGKKFMTSHFEEVLLVNAQLKIETQRQALEHTLNEWMAGFGTIYDQTDDILVFGVSV